MGTNTGLWITSPFPLLPQLLREKVKVFAEFDHTTRQLEMLNVPQCRLGEVNSSSAEPI